MGNSKTIFPYEDMISACAGTIVYPPGGKFGPRLRDDVQLVLLHTGEMNLTVDGEKHLVKPGFVALFKPGTTESYLFSSQQESWHRWISVRFHTYHDKQLEYLDGLPFILPISAEMNQLTDMMLTLLRYHHQDDEIIRSLGLSALHLYASESQRNCELHTIHPSVLRALDFIHGHYDQEITLRDLAAVAGITPEHLVRLFQAIEYITPIKYLWSYRAMKAQELLVNSGLSISEISGRCGFKTTYHFSRTLKQWTGKTPTEVRQSSWN